MRRILNEVADERIRQIEKWGEQNLRPSQWLAVLGEEYGEVCRAVCEMELVLTEKRDAKWWINYRMELVQLAAVAVQAVECFDRDAGRDLSQLPPS
jgi:NTP pyrophosphatase (non-canonical NTP hydrolase)